MWQQKETFQNFCMIDDLVLIFILVAHLVCTNCHLFVNKVMQLNNWLLQRKTKEEEEKKWADQNWKTLWRKQKEKNNGERKTRMKLNKKRIDKEKVKNVQN